MKSCFDTDKAFHMSFDEVTFNADRIRSKLELLSEELMPVVVLFMSYISDV